MSGYSSRPQDTQRGAATLAGRLADHDRKTGRLPDSRAIERRAAEAVRRVDRKQQDRR
jgi:hypothetical protein